MTVASSLPVGATSFVPTPHVLTKVVQESYDTWTLRLEPQDATLPPWRPGQFTMLWLPGLGEAAISMSGDASEPGVLVQTIRAAGSVTNALVALRPGAVVGVRGPFGSTWPVEQAHGRHLVVIAGGLGLAPVRPVIYQAVDHRDRFDRVVVLIGARTPEDLLYRGELLGWASRQDLELEITVDRADRSWEGFVGVVTELLPHAPFDADLATVFVCGPEIMMRFTARALRDRGVADTDVWLSLERNMRCAVGTCGHCQFGPDFVCKDGPVFRLDHITHALEVKEL